MDLNIDKMKVCSTCKIEKEFSEFHKNKSYKENYEKLNNGGCYF